MFRTLELTERGVVMLDQRKLPAQTIYLTLETPEEVAEAIRTMAVRGAPAIGIAAAMGLALGARKLVETGGAHPADFMPRFEDLCEMFAATRPTAVNLFWAIDRMKRAAATASAGGPGAIATRLAEEAETIKIEDLEACRSIGRHGERLVPDGASILTHCNAGGLATAGYGTALGMVRAAVEAGKKIRVLADETRPFLQGARLTAWELMEDGIETTIITDSMAGHFFRKGDITLAVVGADRIAANGDVANKIGTYSVAVLAKENGVPFYVAAPISTIDLSIADGDHIPIEERSEDEVTMLGGVRHAPLGALVRNPAFDVTPHVYVTAIVTDRGIARPPYSDSLKEMVAKTQ